MLAKRNWKPYIWKLFDLDSIVPFDELDHEIPESYLQFFFKKKREKDMLLNVINMT
jgi:hypothetical protein